jgi:GDP-4-dehydro-6-deoxy-D-mannose reductase
MNVLVTGATGCLGRLVVDALRDRSGIDVWTSGRGDRDALGYIACDLVDPSAIDTLIEKTRPEVIFHLAGSFTNDYARDLAVNADCARHLLDAARRRQLRPRTVLIGSAAEYGIVEPGDNPVREQRALRPVSVYGTTKAFQTLLASFYARHHDMDVVVARLFNLYASGISERLFVGRVEHQIERVKRGEQSRIELGSLSARRDYVDAHEAVEQLFLIASRGSTGEVYNLGSGIPILMRDLLKRMLATAGLDSSIVRENTQPAGRSRYDVPVIYADMNKTRNLKERASFLPAWA